MDLLETLIMKSTESKNLQAHNLVIFYLVNFKNALFSTKNFSIHKFLKLPLLALALFFLKNNLKSLWVLPAVNYTYRKGD